LSTPYKQILVIDFETAWDRREYTLSKMTTEEYVRDPRFKAWGMCAKLLGNEMPPVWVRRCELQSWVNEIDWSITAVLAHNAQFDVTILSWVYGAQPCFIFDTLSMARALRGIEAGNSLAKLAEEFGLPPKGQAVHSTDGMLDTIDTATESELADYCKHDVLLCEEIFNRLIKSYPAKELRLIDLTLKMYTRPLLELDKDMLRAAIEEEREARESLLAKLGVAEPSLASNDKFAELLQSLGVEPPVKVSKTTGRETLALAKNDAMFQALLNGDNEDVALLCEARLKVKSTSERTRAQRFLDIAQRGSLPVPLSYYGAKSGRWSAAKGSAINMQNLKRGSFLRKAIMAPEGHHLVVGDLSQIEPRVLAWLADYTEMLDIFRAGHDPYAAFGAQMFNIPGMTKESHPDLRQAAKSALLGCGYGLGWQSFASQLLTGFLGAPPMRYSKDFARALGINREFVEQFFEYKANEAKILDIKTTLSEQELVPHCLAAKAIIDIYRHTAWPVVGLWNHFSTLIERSLAGGEEVVYKCLTFRKGEIVLPNGMSVLYPNLRQKKDDQGRWQWVYGPDETKLYAGKITNNVVQGTARIVMTDGMLRVAKRYPIAGTVHDELIAVVPDDEVADAKTWVLAQMTMEPTYMPGLPLAADGGAHRRYGLAKN
jgi:hypothetical protein